MTVLVRAGLISAFAFAAVGLMTICILGITSYRQRNQVLLSIPMSLTPNSADKSCNCCAFAGCPCCQPAMKAQKTMLAPEIDEKFGVYASQVPNKDPTSRGFDFWAYANDNPKYKAGDPLQMTKFNAQAIRSFELLEARAKRLTKLIKQLETTDISKIDADISPKGPPGPAGPQGPRGPPGDIGPRY